MPFLTNASLLSSIFGTEVSASSPSVISSSTDQSSSNSQTLSLLQANVLPPGVDNSKNTQIGLDENTDINIVSENALLASTGPMGVSDGGDAIDYSSGDAQDLSDVYVVKEGDTISIIADMFDVTKDTITSMNDLTPGAKLTPGSVLFILPFSGVQHTVVKGETLKGIALKYNVDVNDIVLYNDMGLDSSLTVGDDLIIPGASILTEKKIATTKTKVNTKSYYSTGSLQNILGYFINPVPTGRKTQGLHGPGHRGIDIGAPTGTPIYASASGTVLTVKTGCTVGNRRCGGGYGNLAIVVHGNGTKTLYGHMSKLGTSTGAQVSRGQIIGYVGSTGQSTGPHLHFEVFNAKNPGADWSWAKLSQADSN